MEECFPADYFSRKREERRKLRRQRCDEWPTIAAAHCPTWEQKHDTHWQYKLGGDVLDYWPGPKRWRWRGQSMTGDVLKFIEAREVDLAIADVEAEYRVVFGMEGEQ